MTKTTTRTTSKTATKPSVATSLLIDAGNSRIKWVYTRDGELDLKTAGTAGMDVFIERLQKLEAADRIVICSVMSSEQSAELVGACEEAWDVPVQLLASTAEAFGIKNAYPSPTLLGTDRWIAVIAAAKTYGQPVIVMDLGTASTLDAVDDDGVHLGGLIFPGPGVMERSLHLDTRLSTRSGGDDFSGWNRAADSVLAGDSVRGLVATNSGQAVAYGIISAQIGALKEFHEAVCQRLTGRPVIVITGGAGEGIMPLMERAMTESTLINDPWLVFRGMLVFANNHG